MQSLILLSFLVGAAFTAAIDDNDNNSEHFFTNVTKSTDTEITVEIRNGDGDLLGESDFFLDEGFQIEKPTDREVCLVKSNSDNATCYEEKPVSTKISETIWDHCEGREVLLLSPISCDVETEENGHLKETSPHGLRQKRFFYCEWYISFSLKLRCCWYWEVEVTNTLKCGFRFG